MNASRDASSSLLEKSLAEYFEEGYEIRLHAKLIEETEPHLRPQAIATWVPKRSVPEGCFIWITHLIWLEETLKIVPGIALFKDETEGLRNLASARARFNSEHPPCPHCGMPNKKGDTRCSELSCLMELN